MSWEDLEALYRRAPQGAASQSESCPECGVDNTDEHEAWCSESEADDDQESDP